MPRIHPTAIVDEQAELAEDVEVGPGCHIQGRVQIQAGTRLIGSAYLQGPLRIGRDNLIYPNCCLGFAPQDRGFDHQAEGAGVLIGSGNVLREGVTIHRATGEAPTTMGDENYLMVGVHVGHDSQIASHCTFANVAMIGGHVEVGDSVVFGGSAGAHQFCRVGRLALIAGNEGVSQDLPPFCICYHTRTVSSLNLVGLRRAGLRQHIGPLKRAFDILYRSHHGRASALQRIREELGDDPLCQELAGFCQASQRGVTPYANSREVEGRS